MDHNKSLRQHLIKVLEGSEAHAEFEAAAADMPFALQGKIPKGAEHSPWQELEHLRIAQWDIFEFAVDPKHKSPKFPARYWPGQPEPPNEKAGLKARRRFMPIASASLKSWPMNPPICLRKSHMVTGRPSCARPWWPSTITPTTWGNLYCCGACSARGSNRRPVLSISIVSAASFFLQRR